MANAEFLMKVGQLAERAGVHIETIRYYQQLELMPKPIRARGSVRRYGKDSEDRLRFIKRAQGLGFSLDEVKMLLELAVGEHCSETRALADRKLELVEKKIADLRGMQGSLNKLVRACRTGKRGAGCPIIQSLCANDRKAGRPG